MKPPTQASTCIGTPASLRDRGHRFDRVDRAAAGTPAPSRAPSRCCGLISLSSWLCVGSVVGRERQAPQLHAEVFGSLEPRNMRALCGTTISGFVHAALRGAAMSR